MPITSRINTLCPYRLAIKQINLIRQQDDYFCCAIPRLVTRCYQSERRQYSRLLLLPGCLLCVVRAGGGWCAGEAGREGGGRAGGRHRGRGGLRWPAGDGVLQRLRERRPHVSVRGGVGGRGGGQGGGGGVGEGGKRRLESAGQCATDGQLVLEMMINRRWIYRPFYIPSLKILIFHV